MKRTAFKCIFIIAKVRIKSRPSHVPAQHLLSTPTMSLQHFGKATLRVAKNYTKGYSDVQAKVREATSNDPWGPTGQQMNEIAKLSWNQ